MSAFSNHAGVVVEARMSNITRPFEQRPSTVMEPPDHRAAEWGLASVLLGGLLVVTAPIILIVNILMASIGPSALGMDPGAIKLATIGFVIVGLLLLGLGGTGVAFGLASLSAARSGNQSIALGLTGLIVSVVGVFALIVVGVDTGFVLEWFNRSPRR
jgi:hypothetical protein